MGSGHRKGAFGAYRCIRSGHRRCLHRIGDRLLPCDVSGKRSDSSHEVSDAGIGFAFTISQLVAVNR